MANSRSDLSLQRDARSSQRRSIATGSDQRPASPIESAPRISTAVGTDSYSPRDARSSQRRSTATGYDQAAVGTDSDSARDARSSQRRSTATGYDQSSASSAESAPRRSTAVGTDSDSSLVPSSIIDLVSPETSIDPPSAEPAPRRSTAVGTDSDSSLVPSLTIDLVSPETSIDAPSPIRSTTTSSDQSSRTTAQSASSRSIAIGRDSILAVTGFDPSVETEVGSSLDRISSALGESFASTVSSPRGSSAEGIWAQPYSSSNIITIESSDSSGSSTIDLVSPETSIERAIGSTPRRLTIDLTSETAVGSTPQSSTAMRSGTARTGDTSRQRWTPDTRPVTRRVSADISSPRRAIDAGPTPRRITDTYLIDPSRALDIAERRVSNVGTVTRSATGTESIPSRVPDSPRISTTGRPWPSSSRVATAEVTEEECVEQDYEWALSDLSMYQLTMKSLVVAVVVGLQFSSGSNGEGSIFCSDKEGCVWHDKPEGAIGVDFQLDIRTIVAAVISSLSLLLGLSRVPGEYSCWCLMPWLLLVTLSLQKFHIAALLNLLAFLTTCSQISAIILMVLCLILFCLEINVFYEVFLCAWHLHDDPSLK